jgi:hypothetical protein
VAGLGAAGPAALTRQPLRQVGVTPVQAARRGAATGGGGNSLARCEELRHGIPTMAAVRLRTGDSGRKAEAARRSSDVRPGGGTSKQVCITLAPATGVRRPTGTYTERRMGVSCGHGEGKWRQRAHRRGRGRGQRWLWRWMVLRDAGKSGLAGAQPTGRSGAAPWWRHAWSMARCCGASGMREPVQSSSKAFMLARLGDRESPFHSANGRKEKGFVPLTSGPHQNFLF